MGIFTTYDWLHGNQNRYMNYSFFFSKKVYRKTSKIFFGKLKNIYN